MIFSFEQLNTENALKIEFGDHIRVCGTMASIFNKFCSDKVTLKYYTLYRYS